MNEAKLIKHEMMEQNLRHGSGPDEAQAMGQRHRKATQNSWMVRIFALRQVLLWSRCSQWGYFIPREPAPPPPLFAASSTDVKLDLKADTAPETNSR